MSKKFLIFVLIFLILLLTSCGQQGKSEIPDITVSIDGQKIECVRVISDTPNITLNLPAFSDLLENKVLEDLPYVRLESKVKIKLSTSPKIDHLDCYDRILTLKGEDKYPIKLTERIDLTVKNKKTSFVLKTNFTAMLSSDMADYEPGSVIRGFNIFLNYEGKNYIYIFVIRTDPR